MKEVLELIIKNLVENKDAVSVSESMDKNITIFNVKVDSKDMGRVIGKEGKVAKAIRVLMKSLANAERKKISVHFDD